MYYFGTVEDDASLAQRRAQYRQQMAQVQAGAGGAPGMQIVNQIIAQARRQFPPRDT